MLRFAICVAVLESWLWGEAQCVGMAMTCVCDD